MNSGRGKVIFLVLTVLSLLGSAFAGSKHRMLAGDGGSYGLLVITADGGVSVGLMDGGRYTVPTGSSPFCVVDAGAVDRLLGQKECRQDQDCSLVRPGVGGVDCCYSVSVAVAKSKELSQGLDELERACGAINGICLVPCTRAVCVQGRCDSQ